MIPQALEEYLNNSHVPYEVRHHPPTMTAEQLAQRENVDGHQVAKVVVMRENGKYFMMVLPASYFVDLREARRLTGHPNLHFASEPEMQGLFRDCELGAMPPMGPLYNMPVYAETDLADDDEIEFNAGTHEDAIRMKYADWENMTHPQKAHFARNWREYLA
jgi:Ala-tRNA(Pro) deacylase